MCVRLNSKIVPFCPFVVNSLLICQWFKRYMENLDKLQSPIYKICTEWIYSVTCFNKVLELTNNIAIYLFFNFFIDSLVKWTISEIHYDKTHGNKNHVYIYIYIFILQYLFIQCITKLIDEFISTMIILGSDKLPLLHFEYIPSQLSLISRTCMHGTINQRNIRWISFHVKFAYIPEA